MSCRIELDHPGIYSPGDLVCGKVTCTFNQKENIRGIECKLRGKEHTTWTQKQGKNTVRYTGKRTFLSGDVTFIGEGKIEAGVHGYRFAFNLPVSNIPSSYQHPFGTITYYVEATVDRPFAFDYEDQITLHVQVPVTLNIVQQPQCQTEPVMYVIDKEPGCFFCFNGLMTLSMTLEKDIFQLGDVARAKVQISNNSRVDIHEIKATLASNIEFTTLTPDVRKKYEKCVLAKTLYPGARGHCEKTLDVSLEIPQTVVVTSFLGCTLFRHWYSLKIEAVLPTCSQNLILEANVQLGFNSGTNSISAPSGSSTNVVPVAHAPTNTYPSYPMNDPIRGEDPFLPPPPMPDRLTVTIDRYRPSAPSRQAEEENLDFTLREPLPPSYEDVIAESSPPRVPSPSRRSR